MLAIALSGGLDSSVAAALLREAGYELLGLYMRHRYQHDETDLRDAARIAEFLDIRFEVVDVAAEFETIVAYFVEEYLAGRTPNPCVFCNRRIKFGALPDAAARLGADGLATGHYARLLETAEGGKAVHKGVDPNKDQSYVLFGIERKRFDFLHFPIGDYTKDHIRSMVAERSLPLPPKRESQDICFVHDGAHAAFVRSHRPDTDTAGHFIDRSGRILAPHSGFERFTIGQRKGMGVGFGKRLFVVKIDPETKNIILGEPEDLACRILIAEQCNWHVDVPNTPFRCEVKVRYRTRAKKATVIPAPGDPGSVCIKFEELVYGAAPGQCAVFYAGDRLLGGGWIQSSLDDPHEEASQS